VVWRAGEPHLQVPYVLALVDLDEGVRLMIHIVNCPHDQLAVGVPVRVRFDPPLAGRPMPPSSNPLPEPHPLHVLSCGDFGESVDLEQMFGIGFHRRERMFECVEVTVVSQTSAAPTRNPLGQGVSLEPVEGADPHHGDQLGAAKSGNSPWSRFAVVELLPNTVLLVLVVALSASGAANSTPSLNRLAARLHAVSWIEVVAGAFAILVVSFVVYPLQPALVRLFEGYWGETRVGRMLAQVGIDLHRRRWSRLVRIAGGEVEPRRDGIVDEALDELERYPADDDRLLPTRLGNILRAAEDSAGQRYGLDTVTLWPRLHPYVTGALAESLTSVRDQLDLSVRLCATLIVATLVATGLLVNDGWWLLVPATTAVVAWIAYHSAVSAAAAYGEDLHVAFDLHRFDMLEGMHYPLPTNLDEEHERNDELTRFLQSGRPIGGRSRTHRYSHATAGSELPAEHDRRGSRQLSRDADARSVRSAH
jgi:DUF35 OB-fold domain, acyl-CoA-associated